jgi:hypothetical protein
MGWRFTLHIFSTFIPEGLIYLFIYLLQLLAKYGFKKSTDKSKTVAIKGRDCIRSRIVENCKIIEQVNTLSYLGSSVKYQNEK